MAVRLTGIHNSYYGDVYKIEIIDTSGGGGGVFTIRGDGYDITPVGEPSNPHKIFNPSTCSFTMLVDPRNSGHISFVEDLKSSPKNRFFIKAYHNGNLDFAGPVTMNGVTYEDVPSEYDLNIVASDGISGLSGIDYNDAGVAYTGRVTYMEHIINCLNKIGVNDLYGSTDALTVVFNWYANEMPGAGTDNPFDMMDVDHELFIKRGDDGQPIYKKCMEVIEILLTPVHCCMRYDQGKYWIENIGTRTNTTFIGWTYNLSGTQTQLQNFNLDYLVEQNKGNFKNSKFSLRGRRYRFLDPLREVQVKYRYEEEFTPVSKDVTWNNVSGDNCGPQILIGNEIDSLILRVKGLLRLKTTIDPTEQTANGFKVHRYYFKLRIRVLTNPGSTLYTEYRREIDRLSFYNLNVKEGLWGAEGDTEQIDLHSTVISEWNNGTNVYVPIIFETKELDVSMLSSLLYQVCFETDGVRDVDGNIIDPLNYDLEWAFENVVVTAVDGDAGEGKAIEIEDNLKAVSDEQNTEVYKIETVLGDQRNQKNSILVNDGSNWVKPTGWGINGAGTHDTLIELLMDEILALRSKPMEIANMTITGKGYDIKTTGRYIWNSLIYLFDVGTKNSDRGELSGDYIALARAPVTSVKTNVKVITKVDTFATRQGDGGQIDIPPPPNEGISVITDIIQEGQTVTSLSIPAASYNYFRAGDIVEVRDPGTGNKQKFTVAADVNQGDTSIGVNSVASAVGLGQESKVIFDWAYESGQTYNETKEKYEFFSVDEGNVLASATELQLTAFTGPAASTPIEQARKRIRPQRNGVWMRMVADVSTYAGQQPLRVFEWDGTNQKILLHSTAPVDAWDEFDVFGFEIIK